MKSNSERTILITGGAGFIGSNLLLFLAGKHKNWRLINLDKLTYAADLSVLKALDNNPNYIFVKGDICDENLIKKLFAEYKIDGVMHLAACSHVDNSIKSPKEFIKTNIEGTFTLLDGTYHAWHYGPFKVKDEYKNARFHIISTDEVYGSLETGSFTELSRFAPNSPYSASKASADMLARITERADSSNVTLGRRSVGT